MQNENYFKKVSVKTIKSKPDRYIDAFKTFGFIVFPKSFYTDEEVASIAETFSSKMNWDYYESKNKILDSFIHVQVLDKSKGYKRKHLMFEQKNKTDEIKSCFINLQKTETLEGDPEYQIVLRDMQNVFSNLPEEYKNFLSKTLIHQLPSFVISEDEIMKFIHFCSNACDPIWAKVDENLLNENESEGVAEAVFAKPAVRKNSNTGEMCLNISTTKDNTRPTEYICKFDNRIPSKKEKEMFNDIFQYLEKEIEKFEECFFYKLLDGDLLLIDAQRMLIGSNSYISCEQDLKYLEVGQKTPDSARKRIHLNKEIDTDKLTKIHKYLLNKNKIEESEKPKKKRPQQVSK